MTLLEQYIQWVQKGFREPEKKGVQKGEPIGISLSRHNAALFSMYSGEQKELAERAGISHAFFRKLRTFESFRKFIKSEREAFVELYLHTYLETGRFIKINSGTFSSLDEFDSVEIPPEIALADVALYCLEMKQYISKHIQKMIKKLPKDEVLEGIFSGVDRVYFLMANWQEPELNKQIYQKVVEFSNQIICGTLADKMATVEMRNQAINCSNFIFKLSTTL